MTKTNEAFQKEIENSTKIFELKDKHRMLINILIDTYQTPDHHVEQIEQELIKINKQIIHYAKQQRHFRKLRNQSFTTV